MPFTFPHYEPDTDQLVDHTYYDVAEVADMLHLSTSTVRRNITEGRWPALRVGHGHVYLSAAMIGEVVAMLTTDTRPEPEPEPPRLGTPLADPDTEPLT